jgi:hypothetical protein
MADEAFALSPISARAAQPSEADYDAIREAFMETARGRWFLGEYAKRNRNADTSMVLDAVARIEEALAVQQRQPAPDNRFEEALAAIRSVVDQTGAMVSASLDGLRLEEQLAAIRKGARVVREISWRWREIGADGRICDLLDSQVGAIEAGCKQISSADPRTILSAAFDVIRAGIEELADGDAPAGADAHDEAMLDLVAMEMAAPDETHDIELAEPEFEQPPLAAAASVGPESAPPEAEAAAAAVEEPTAPLPQAVAPPLNELPRDASPELSLGSTIIASGILRNSNVVANDPLAPIRRMSQAEKIAFFS